MRELAPRKLRLSDALIVIATVAVGLGLVRAYQASLDWAGVINPLGRFPRRIKWFGLPGPFAAALTVGLLLLRFTGPGPRGRRLIRMPGFAACCAGCFSVALAAISCGVDYVVYALSTSRGPLFFWHFGMRSISFTGPGIASVWFVYALLGYCRLKRRRDWVEACAILIGIAWLVLFAATCVNV
jgi:hypothetical protein